MVMKDGTPDVSPDGDMARFRVSFTRTITYEGFVEYTKKTLKETMHEGVIPDDGDYADAVSQLLEEMDHNSWPLEDVSQIDAAEDQLEEVTME